MSKILSAFAVVFIVAYICYQGYLMAYNPYKTVTVVQKTVSETIDTDIFVIRDEAYITNDAKGTIVPTVQDGSKVAKGQEVAVVFSDASAASNYTKVQELEEKIQRYQVLASQTENYSFDIDTIDDKILSDLWDVLQVIDSGELENLTESSDTLRDQITSRQIATGTEMDFNKKISTLQAQLQELQSKSSDHGSVTAADAGYYISATDGFESSYDYSKVSSISVDDVEKVLKAKPDDVPSNAMGKLVNSFDWYMVCNISSKKIGSLKVGDSLTVKLPFSSVSEISAKVYSINDTHNGKTAIVLKSNYMDSHIANLREENAEIVINEYEGYKVDASAVREVEGQKGVYILRGNLVSFRKINILYTTSNYIIASPYTGESGYLKLYDEVIVEGKDLYDGKIIS